MSAAHDLDTARQARLVTSLRARLEDALQHDTETRRRFAIWHEVLAGQRCTCAERCTNSTWGDRNCCDPSCIPCAVMAGQPYDRPPKTNA